MNVDLVLYLCFKSVTWFEYKKDADYRIVMGQASETVAETLSNSILMEEKVVFLQVGKKKYIFCMQTTQLALREIDQGLSAIKVQRTGEGVESHGCDSYFCLT